MFASLKSRRRLAFGLLAALGIFVLAGRDAERVPVPPGLTPAPGVAVCWAPPAGGGGTPPPVVVPGALAATVDLSLRWSGTALGGAGPSQGDPIVITYSFVPDGTIAPSGTGEPSAPSELFTWLDSVFGTTAAWQQIFHDEFARWGEACGVSYVFEPNDDGAALYTTPGAPGVRGDVRVAAKPIDGTAQVLAFNFLPPFGGDMVLDSSDGFLQNLANDARGIRNTISHEHGHGLGLAHVCPTSGDKLMEPLITLGFLGPAIDDRRGAQRLYGDRLEPNDSAVLATDLGPLPDTITTLSGISTDDDADEDWFRFTVAPGRQITVTLTPQGGSYLEGPQNSDGSCTAGTLVNAGAISDLGFEIWTGDGSTLLVARNQLGAGAIESLVGFSLPAAGDYLLRVTPDAADDVQLYDLDIQVIAPLPPFVPVFTTPPPTTIAPETRRSLALVAAPGSTLVDASASVLRFRTDDGVYASHPVSSLSATFVEVHLPPLAPYESLEWYVELVGQDGSVVFEPSFGAAAPRRLVAEPDPSDEVVFFSDDFTSDLGWSVVNGPGLTAGAWERGVPMGGGTRGDPAAAFDADGFCYLTSNLPGNSDVDGGSTALVSPLVDLSGALDARMSYAFWFDNDEGSNPDSKSLDVEVSSDGGANWTRIETFSGSPGAWQTRDWRLRDFIEPTATMQFRFVVDDGTAPSILEAGIDDFSLRGVPLLDLGPWAAGYVDDLAGGRADLLRIDGDAGGVSRRIVRAVGQPFAFEVGAVPGAIGPTQFAIFARLGVATPGERFLVDPEIGAATFVPCPLWPTNPFLFTLADGIGLGAACPPVLPATPAPWAFGLPIGIPGPVELTLQAAVLADGEVQLANALVLEIQ